MAVYPPSLLKSNNYKHHHCLIDQLMPQIYENFSYKFFRLETVPENWCSASSSSSDEDSDSDERDSGTRREFRELRR